MSINFSKGDIVQLKSGGPKMTVEEVTLKSMVETEIVKCQWFSGSKLQDGWFNPDSLLKVESSLIIFFIISIAFSSDISSPL